MSIWNRSVIVDTTRAVVDRYLLLSSFFRRFSYSLISSLKRPIELRNVSLNVKAYALCNAATLQCARPSFTSALPANFISEYSNSLWVGPEKLTERGVFPKLLTVVDHDHSQNIYGQELFRFRQGVAGFLLG